MNRPTLTALIATLSVPAILAAQQGSAGAEHLPPTRDLVTNGAWIMQSRAAKRPVASQFDTAGTAPLGAVGDSVTIYYFPNGATLGRYRHAVIARRTRTTRPAAWRRACDTRAYAGWQYQLKAPASNAFAVVLRGTLDEPIDRPAPPLARSGAASYFKAWTDSVWHRYETKYAPMTERQHATLYYNFHTDSLDAGWRRIKLWGIHGPDGHNYAVFSAWLRDDQTDGSANTTATWIVNGWGYPVARAPGNVDIYGVSDADGDGIDEVVTSAGVILWDGSEWRFPQVYRDEPCMLHRVTDPPPGWQR